ncbi:ParB N-terminal domain-containing protein [Streptomyces sp. NPDC050636]|uniref:ParB/RepB/Spo0J family partition protein n=1 Tax=Streptomyces sp. NPDC050636 TaxID=3154510 RepID=UPI00343ECAB8
MSVAVIDTEQTTENPEALPAFTGHFAWVDPHDLVIDPYNHRRHREHNEEDTTEPDPDLITSVQEVGVQSLLLLRPQTGDNEGRLGIIFGQRRNKAALIAAQKAKDEGRPYMLVPALIRDDLQGVDDEALALSVIENKHRKDTHARDYIEAAQQLSLMDVPSAVKDRHARTIGLTREEMDAAQQASNLSNASLQAGLDADFDLVELADFQEVESIDYARNKLQRAKERDLAEGTGNRGHWAHAMNELREKNADQAKRARLIAELTNAGITMIDWRRTWHETRSRPLEDLLTQLGKPMTPDAHACCPGHAASVHHWEAEVTWLCADWKKNHHELTPEAAKSAASSTTTEAEKEARRKTIRYNKAWRSVRLVRQEFITKMCDALGEASNEVWELILNTITGTSHTYSQYVSRHRTDLVAAFLKVKDPNHDSPSVWQRVTAPFTKLIARTGKTRRWRLLLAQVAAMYEYEAMDDHAWRDSIHVNTVDWLTFLENQGYVLSDIENEVLTTGREQLAKAREQKAKDAA